MGRGRDVSRGRDDYRKDGLSTSPITPPPPLISTPRKRSQQGNAAQEGMSIDLTTGTRMAEPQPVQEKMMMQKHVGYAMGGSSSIGTSGGGGAFFLPNKNNYDGSTPWSSIYTEPSATSHAIYQPIIYHPRRLDATPSL